MLIMRLSKKMPAVFQVSIAVAILVARCAFILSVSSKTLLLMSVCSAALPSSVLCFIRPGEISASDFLFLSGTFLLPFNAFNSSYSTMGMGTWLLLFLFSLLLFDLLKNGSLKGRLTDTYFAFLVLSIISVVFLPTLNHFFPRSASRELHSLVAALIVVILFLFISALLAKRSRRFQFALRKLERHYPATNKTIVLFMVSSAVFLLLLPFAFLWVGATSGRLRALMIIFQFMFFAFQLAFLYLIYRMSEYRTTLTFLEKNQNSQESYYHELNTNLQDMENLRHDIKNLFLTMSGFVARSDDDEMKAFYREKIYPFALNEVEHNYQFSRLYEIPDETLRAFLYTKLSQANVHGSPPILDIKLNAEQFFIGVDIIDLTRILGILLDNAFEECSDCTGTVELKIRNLNDRVSYCISNPICPGHTVKITESSKPGHMGRGLNIVHGILDCYPQAALNTYNDGKTFVQALNIGR